MALNFPSPASQGDEYVADNGITYVYDGTKWIGNTPVANPFDQNLNTTDNVIFAKVSIPGIEDNLTPSIDFFTNAAGNHIVTLDSDWTLKLQAAADNTNQGHLWLQSGYNTKIKVNGNGSTIDVVASDGADISTWTFKKDGTLSLPPSSVNTSFFSELYFTNDHSQTVFEAYDTNHLSGEGGSKGYGPALILDIDSSKTTVRSWGNNVWDFGYDGALTLPHNTTIADTSDGAIAIGQNAGFGGSSAVSLGSSAGHSGQGYDSIAIGGAAGYVNQSPTAIAIGGIAGYDTQGAGAVAIGSGAGQNTQGDYAVAIGVGAGNNNQPANSIIITANGTGLDGTESGLYIDPVRNDTGNVSNAVYYNTTTKELTYGPAGGGGSSDRLVNGNNQVVLGSDGTLSLPQSSVNTTFFSELYFTNDHYQTVFESYDTNHPPGEAGSKGKGPAVILDLDSSQTTIRAWGNKTWEFGYNGVLTFPDSSLTIGDRYGASTIQAATDLVVQLLSSGENGSAGIIWTDNADENTRLAAVVVNNPLFVGNADVGIVTGDQLGIENGVTNIWNFGADGNLTVPNNSYISTSDLTQAGFFIGDDNQFIRLAASGDVIVQSRYNTGADVYIQGANAVEGNEGGCGDVYISGGTSGVTWDSTDYQGAVNIETDKNHAFFDGQYGVWDVGSNFNGAKIYNVNYANDDGTLNSVTILAGAPLGDYDNAKYWRFNPDGTTDFPAYTFTADDGLLGQALTTDGEGTVTWISPVNISDTAPDTAEGTIWFNNTDGRSYVKYNGVWTDMNPVVIPPPETYLDGLTISENMLGTREAGHPLYIDANVVVGGNITPFANVTYDLGSPTAQWRDLYLSSSSIYLGGNQLSVVNGSLNLNGRAPVLDLDGGDAYTAFE